jgi:phosphomannomutase
MKRKGPMDKLEFGTDGWRDIIAERFTYANVERVAQAYASYLLEQNTPSVVIGFDTRFSAGNFAELVAKVMAANGIQTYLSSTYLPTPALSFAVKHYGAGGGVMLTASHNPPAYLGFKLKGPYGGTATSEIYQTVSRLVQITSEAKVKRFDPTLHSYELIDIRYYYYEALCSLLDIDALRKFKGLIAYDAMGGAGAGWLTGFLKYADINIKVQELRGEATPLFYGVNPEPIPANLALSITHLRNSPAVFGTATDGDADRLGLILPNGRFFNSHQIFAILLNHLYQKGLSGSVVKTFTVSRIIERLAAARGLEVLETPVGFKYITAEMLKGDVLIGGEESGGIAVKGHLPERDGIANSLLILEAVATSGKPLADMFRTIEHEVGWQHAFDRLDLHLSNPHKKGVMQALKNPPSRFVDRTVESVEKLDGIKLNLSDQAWILFRASGTEPLLRIYCEASDQASVARLLTGAQTFVEQVNVTSHYVSL